VGGRESGLHKQSLNLSHEWGKKKGLFKLGLFVDLQARARINLIA